MKIFSFIGVLALLIWYVPAMVWGVQVTDAMVRFQDGEMDALTGVAEGPAPLAWWRNRTEVAETFSAEELNTRRRVLIQTEMPFEDLLNEGEAAPDSELRSLYVAARAPKQLHGYCAELLEVLATRCDIVDATGRVRGEGTAWLEGTLLYTPAYEMGDPTVVNKGDLYTARAALTDGSVNGTTPEGRAEIITRSLTVCDGVREAYGNCVVTVLTMDEGRAFGFFDVYANKTQNSMDTVGDTVQRVAAAMLGNNQ